MAGSRTSLVLRQASVLLPRSHLMLHQGRSRVAQIILDPKTDMAKVYLQIQHGTKLTDDVIASVRTRAVCLAWDAKDFCPENRR